MNRVLLGSWATPSGNSVDAFLSGEGRVRTITCEWDRYPLADVDRLFYLSLILPAITKRVAKFTERPGRALVIPA